MRLSRAVLVLTLVLLGTPGMAARFPKWAVDATDEVALERYADADAVVLLEHWQLRLKGGARTGTRRRLVHVLTEEGGEHTTVGLASSSFDRYERIRVWVRQPNGNVTRYSDDDGSLWGLARQRVLDERTVLIITPPDVAPGTRVAMEANLSRSADIPQDLFPLQLEIPVAVQTVVVDRRGGWDVDAQSFAVGAEARETETGRLMWEFRDLPASPVSPSPAAPAAPAAILSLNYVPPDGTIAFRTWSSTVRWVREWFRSVPAGLSDVETTRPAGQNGETDLIEAAGKAARKLRYFSIALGAGGFIPRPPSTTLARGFGDCKDKSQVMIALLAQRGQSAYPALIMSRSDGYVPEDLPSPFLFNHMVVAIPWEGRDVGPGMTIAEHAALGPLRIYDATLSEASGMDTGLHLEGAPALVLDPSTSALVHLPESPAASNRLTRDHHLEIAEDGTVSATVVVAAAGFWRTLFESEGGSLVSGEDLEDLTRAVMSGVAREAQGLRVQPIEKQDDGEWTYRGEYRVPGLVTQFGAVGSLEIGSFLDLDLVPLPGETEGAPTYVPWVGSWVESFRIDYPGAIYIGAEQGFDVSNDVGRARVTLKQDAGLLEVQRELELVSREIPPAQAEQLIELRRAVRRLNHIVLLFE